MISHQWERRINAAIGITASALSLYVVARMAFGPDVLARMRMRGCLIVSHTAKRGADVLVTVGAKADTAYHKARNVTV